MGSFLIFWGVVYCFEFSLGNPFFFKEFKTLKKTIKTTASKGIWF